MHQRDVVTLILLLLAGFSASGQGGHPFVVRQYTKLDYGAENQNWSVTIDQKGFVYAANNVGLLEFDGVEWNFFPAPNGTVIRSVEVDRNDRIYTSGYREIGYWDRDPTGKLNYHSLNPLAESLFTRNEEFWNTLMVGDKVYFHSFSSVFIYDGQQFDVIREDALIHSISELDGKICLHLSGKGLYVLEDTILTPFLSDPALEDDVVRFCTSLSDSSILIGTSFNGLFLLKSGTLEPYLEEWKEYFSGQMINHGAISPGGDLIIGTILDGVLIFDPEGNLLHHINSENGLQNNTVLGIRCGEDGNIWLALDKGLDYISFGLDPSYSIYAFEGLGAVYAASVFEGDLYLCTNQGVFYREWNNEGDPFRIVQGTQGQAWDCDVYDGELLVSHNQGTFRIQNHRAESISGVSGGFSLIRNPGVDRGLIQSTYSNIVFFENRSGRWQYDYQLPGFNDLIRYIELDHLNNLWAGHMHRGIFRIRLNDTRDSILEVEYPGEAVFGKDFDIQVFKVENRIIFTTGERIYTYSDLQDTIIPYENLNRGLGRFRESHRVVAGFDHHYWFISKTGIGLFRIDQSGIRKVREYPIGLFRDHLITEYENIYPVAPFEGLLCLDNGYAILHARQEDLSRSIEDKELILRSVEIKGRSGKTQNLPLGQKTFRIPFNKNSLILKFAFPVFTSETIRFQYYAEGLEDQWSQPLESPVFQFTRIPAGTYRIHYRASNAWGNHSSEHILQLQVRKPWYLSQVGFVVYTCLLLAGFFAVRSILISRIRERERRIRETKEKELIRLRNEKLNAELSFKSQELANLTMAMIKKNEFLLDLKENIKKQKEELGPRFPEKYAGKLLKKIDSNISSMDDWKVFEIHFEKAHEKFLQKLINKYPGLSHSDLRLCAYLRMNLSSKEIAPLLRISYRGVENHRYRLRKKLNLRKEENLTDFILSI